MSHLVCADARHIPLADNSVQCVVTSPPYWGLRKYAGDQELVWEPDTAGPHEHEWHTESTPLMAVGRQMPHGDGRPVETDHYAQMREPRKGHLGVVVRGTCVHCGAWRGAYGLEPTIEMYVAHTVEILREIRRVLRPDGVVFLNLGDSYAANRGNTEAKPGRDNMNATYDPPTVKRAFGGKRPIQSRREKRAPACGTDGREFLSWMESGCACSCHDDERLAVSSLRTVDTFQRTEPDASPPSQIVRDSEPLDYVSASQGGAVHGAQESNTPASSPASQASPFVRFCSNCLSFHRSASQPSNSGTSYHVPKPKDLCLIPARVAIAAQADGWWIRSMIIWAKPNPMPESVTDRPTDAYEHIIMLTKSERYYWDAEAVREQKTEGTVNDKRTNDNGHRRERGFPGAASNGGTNLGGSDGGRNVRNVWTFATQPYSGAHFATFPEELPRRCILAASKVGDLVLDPFGGSGTTGRVAIELRRRCVLLDLAYTHEYGPLAKKRTTNVQLEAFA